MAWKPDYVTSAEFKNYVGIPDNDDDARVAIAVTSASRSIDRTCKRQFGKVTGSTIRYYTAYYHPVLERNVVDIDDLYDDTGLTIDVDTEGDGTYSDELTDYSLRPINAEADGMPWTQIAAGPDATIGLPLGVDQVRVTTDKFGWSDVPGSVKQACFLQAHRFFSRRNSPYGVAGSPENGSELRLLNKLDPDVEVSLADYKRVAPRDWFV